MPRCADALAPDTADCAEPPGDADRDLAAVVPDTADEFFEEWGDTEALVEPELGTVSAADAARRNRPCLLFFDEIDALGQKRSQLRHGGAAMRGVVNQTLAELDGATSDNEGVFVLAASNHPWDIDSALLRPGRFDRSVLVLPPDAEAREAILRVHLRGRPAQPLDLRSLAKSTQGFSGAVQPITQRQLAEAVRSIRPSIGEWMETAKNYALYGNDSGAYDELAAYPKHRRR